jgi:hypothetical protein
MSRTYLNAVLLTALVLLLGACSGEAEKKSETVSVDDAAKIAAIQETLTEAITRWHYGDMTVLYENEFPYLRDEHTLEEYLDHRNIKTVSADSVEALIVKSVDFYGSDSADAKVDIIFVGDTGDTTRRIDTYRVYYYDGRWIKPTLSSWTPQMEHERVRRTADSAAAAEEEDQEW